MALVKYNNNSISAVTALDSIASGSLVLLATNNITSGVASSSFTSNIDSTYNTYMFKFINIHPSNNNVNLLFNMSTDGGSNYNVTKTTTFFRTTHTEDDATTNFSYVASYDLAQGTGGQRIGFDIGNAGDASCSGELYLFSPSNTTFVKHFIANTNRMTASNSAETFVGGYGNTTSAVDAVDFAISSGTIDSGVIKMYGLKES